MSIIHCKNSVRIVQLLPLLLREDCFVSPSTFYRINNANSYDNNNSGLAEGLRFTNLHLKVNLL